MQISDEMVSEWQPIESAPRNHFPILTWSLAQGQCVAFLVVSQFEFQGQVTARTMSLCA